MNFNSQICTSREQSERLLALGLKKETADCGLYYNEIKGGYEPFIKNRDFGYGDIPAWSLHRLMLLIASNRKVFLMRNDFDAFDFAVERIEWAIIEEDFNKEYLEE